MSKIYQLAAWMPRVILRVVHADVTLDELNADSEHNERLFAEEGMLFAEIKTFEDDSTWIIGLELETGKVVAVPWWYFREAEGL